MPTTKKFQHVFVFDKEEEEKCGGCNWPTNAFYGIGRTKKKAKKNLACSGCMLEIIQKDFKLREKKSGGK